jgi:hypothetical protein
MLLPEFTRRRRLLTAGQTKLISINESRGIARQEWRIVADIPADD